MLLASILAASLLTSCATKQEASLRDPAQSITPSNWSNVSGERAETNWIARFGDPTLGSLVREAEESNFGLEAAEYRINAAKAVARISGSLRLPAFGVDLRSSENKTLVTINPPVPLTSESHSLNLSARWEIDLWNRLGKEYQASEYEYLASQADYEALRQSLASQVAKAWFDSIEARSQFELATASAESFESNLQTLERRYQRGLVDAFDLRLTRAQAAASRSNAVARRLQMDTSIRFLEVLLGRYPKSAIDAADALPELSLTPTAGLPSSLLSRRPDLRAERQRLEATLSRAKSVNRNWLPSLGLTASDGTLSTDFSELLDDNFNVWSIAAAVTAPLYQGGRLKAEREQLDSLQQAQLAQYRDSVLRAFREVESSLRGEADLQELEEQIRIAADENSLAVEQAWNLYNRGLVDIISVLDAERRSFEARSQLIAIKNRRLQNRIDLHIALGGDFKTP